MLHHRPRLLIVDDDPSVRESLSDWFSGSGYRVNVASSAAGALDWFDRNSGPCLVLSDFRMADMDGLELARAIARRFPECRAKIILVTGWVGLDYRDIPSVVGLVRKPFDVHALSALVATHSTLPLQ